MKTLFSLSLISVALAAQVQYVEETIVWTSQDPGYRYTIMDHEHPQEGLYVNWAFFHALEAGLEFAGGVAYGLVAKNQLMNIETCSHDLWDGAQRIYNKFWKYLMAHEWLYMLASAIEIQVNLCEQDFPTCEKVPSDLEVAYQWGQIFTDFDQLKRDVTKNVLLHHKEIMAEVDVVKNDLRLQKWFQAGWGTGELIYYAVGPMQ